MLRYFSYLTCLISSLLSTSAFSHEEVEEELFPSTPEQIATLTSEPSYLVGGLINPLSGHPALRQTDMVVKGAQNIVLSRTYIPPYMPCSLHNHKHDPEEWDKFLLYDYLKQIDKGWKFYPHLKIQFYPNFRDFLLADPNGMTLDFRLSGPNGSVATLISPSYALSNAVGDTPNGKYDPRNTRITYDKNNNKIVVYAPDATVRFYYKKRRELYLLGKEVLPNGKILRYRYNDKAELECVESLDPKERFVYASIRINGIPRDGSCHFTSSSGTAVDYSYERRYFRAELKHHGRKRKGYYPPVLASVSSPSYRHESLQYSGKFLLDGYSGKNDVFTVSHGGFGDGAQHYKVDKLFLPVGQSDAFVPVYGLSYQPPIAGQKEGATTVKNSDGTSIIYHFSKNLLTTLIQYFGQDGGLKKEKVLSWDDRNWLKFIEMRDGQKNILYKRSYEYDRFGNPKLEVFTGNLAGEGAQESFTIKRIFSEDGRNLLLREENDDGKVFSFSYHPSSNLVTSKLTKDGNKVILREFSAYDDCNNLIQTIADDGSGEERDDLSDVTQRIVTTYTLRQSAPFLHMPEWVEEKYWEAGVEKLLQRTHLLYDQYGNVNQEEVCDAEGVHRFTICKTYNERGDLLTETNRLGQKAVYTHDLRGRPETSTNFSHRLRTTFRHDTKGRLREQTEKGDNGIVHVTTSEYDFHDRKIQKRDSFQNTTRYTYDPLVSEITKTDFPSIASVDGEATHVTTCSSYDPFGRELAKKDANGNTTIYRYNAYGSPIEIIHPDGGKEIFRYAKNGKLATHIDPDGLAIRYKHDVLGRVLSKTYVSTEGSSLAEETFTCKGHNLVAETDKEGHLKQYSYDGAGRKTRERFCSQITDFSYDSLGRLDTACKYNGGNTLLIHYKRDLEGQIIEEHKKDASGRTLFKINYSYDEDGNRETITRHVNGKEAVHAFTYDPFRRLVEEIDVEGYVSGTVYDENFTNQLGQNVLKIARTDPLDMTTIETQDALGRTVKKETLNSQSSTIACQEMTLDPQGNLLYRKDHVYENDRFRSAQTIKYTYTPNDQIESLTRAFGTKDARVTAYTYFPSGKMATKTLSDGVTLSYSYHPLGVMSRLDSSDGKIHHAFEYDRLGYLRYALDENLKISIKREVDPYGNVIQEVFPCGLEVKKDYDDFNRLISLKMGSLGEVIYIYDPLFLREVTRISGEKKVLYTHSYEEYDEDGNLVYENLIGNLGQVIHATDPRGQKVSIFSPYFSQECGYDPVGNLITNVTDGTEHGYSYDGLSQLSSETGSGQSCIYAHDSLYNRMQKNGKVHDINGLNELLSLGDVSCLYELNGNQFLKKTPSEISRFTYDPLNRLVEATSEKKKVNFFYDPLGRRLSKVVYTPTAHGWKEASHENYLYQGQNEIGAFTSDEEPKNLRVFGLSKHKNSPETIGVEIEGQVFAPILDVQGNIRRLVDLETGRVTNSYDFTAFGEELRTDADVRVFNPWRFASKRYDPEFGLIDFGKRYYDPLFGRWLTTDPAGFIDSVNLYQYVFNNPFRYRDPDGQMAFMIPLLIWGVEVALPTLSAVAPYVCAAAITYGGYKVVSNLNKTEVFSPGDYYTGDLHMSSETNVKEGKKKHNTNPFDGPVSDEVFVVDSNGNVIKVPQNHQLGGSKDGKCIQVKDDKGRETGTRMDGKGHSASHTDPRAQQPHAHVPEVSNEDGTPWLPIH